VQIDTRQRYAVTLGASISAGYGPFVDWLDADNARRSDAFTIAGCARALRTEAQRRLLDAWPTLPQTTRVGIMATVAAVSGVNG